MTHDHSHDHSSGGQEEHVYHHVEPSDPTSDAGVQRLSGPTAINLAEAQANQRRLTRATVFVLVFFVVEIVGGVWAGSLAIVTDAAHLLTDVSGFILAIIANQIATRPACDKLTYGPVRAEVLSALFSTVAILALSMILVYSAICRLIEFSRGKGEDIDGRMMSAIALIGLLVNVALLVLLSDDHGGHGHDHSHGHAHVDHESDDHTEDHDSGYMDDTLIEESARQTKRTEGTGNGNGGYLNAATSELTPIIAPGSLNGLTIEDGLEGDENVRDISPRLAYGSTTGEGSVTASPARKEANKRPKRNLNMEAAMLHAVTDLVQSGGVLIAGLIIWWDSRLKWADPIVTLMFVALVVHSTRWLLKRAFNVLLEGVPETINYKKLENRLLDIEGVTDVHCLHVWSLTMGRAVVSAHMKASEPNSALAQAHKICEDMGVAHSTIQVQKDECMPANCRHPCVSSNGTCCSPSAYPASPRMPTVAPFEEPL